ncbi:helix-turn-helix transcriptional regulator [Teredinibacter turnerae]|uniref:helix-turn-helix domain-containing protein n=1 Tax=Teredinibacter turnerae TaxID=2426 RepID=UPI000376EEBD|nr:helix-turn-helix transcriptional regulator [Teredinibacter turnerae]
MIDESQLRKIIGTRIKELRTKSGKKQLEIATAVDLKRTSITNIEAGKQMITIPVLYRICHELEVNIDDVMPTFDDLLRHKVEANQSDSGVEIGGKTMAALKRVRNV